MFLSEFEYKKALFYLDHPRLRPSLLKELDCWGREVLETPILNWYCDEVNRGGRSDQRLRLILWDREDQERMMVRSDNFYGYDPALQRTAAQQFSVLAQRHRRHRGYWDPEGFFVVFDTLRDEIQKRVLERARPRLESLAERGIWRIMVSFGAVHIFYETEEQRRRHEVDGGCEAFRQKCGKIVAAYDERRVFEVGPPCIFTSRQTLEEKYEGSLFYYFR